MQVLDKVLSNWLEAVNYFEVNYNKRIHDFV